MTSLVERLRLADCKLDGRKLEDYADKLCKEAAAEITRLTAALEKAEAKNAVAERLAAALVLHNNAYGPNTKAQKLLVEVLNEWKGLTDEE